MAQECGSFCGLSGGSAYQFPRSVNGLKCSPYAVTNQGVYGLDGVVRRGCDGEARPPVAELPPVVNTPFTDCCFMR